MVCVNAKVNNNVNYVNVLPFQHEIKGLMIQMAGLQSELTQEKVRIPFVHY